MFGFLGTVAAFVAVYYVPILAIYLAGGIVYAVAKWVLKAVILRSEINALVPPTGKGWDDAKLAEWKTERRSQLTREVFGQYAYPPKVANAKGKLFGWALFWPINLIWTMFADVARNVWLWLYNTFGAMLQRLSDKILPKD